MRTLDKKPKRKAAVAMPSVELTLWNRVPPEVQFPVEAAPRHVGAGDVFKRLVTNDVDDRRHNRTSAHHQSTTSALQNYTVLRLVILMTDTRPH